MLTITSASSPVYADAAQQQINLEVKFEELENAVPFSASANDVEAHGRALYSRALQGEFGAVSPYVAPPVTESQFIAQVIRSAQDRLDNFAKSRNYDGILSACTYATSTIPEFAAEGQYAVTSRDATWAKCYDILAEVQVGTRPMPSLAEIESELPPLVWPL